MLRTILGKLIAPFRPSPLSLQSALTRCSKRIPRVSTLIDVGASDGYWSLQARRFFPGMACFMIEEAGSILRDTDSPNNGEFALVI